MALNVQKRPGQHLVRHHMSAQVAAAAAATFGLRPDNDVAVQDVGRAILHLRQPHLRQTFARVYGHHTTSGNNKWMRGKLLQAVGLNSRWQPDAGLDDGAAQPLQQDSADSRQARRRKSGAPAALCTPPPKRARPGAEAPPSQIAQVAGSAAKQASKASPPVVVVLLAGDPRVAPHVCAPSTALPGALDRASSAPRPPSPGTLSHQQSEQLGLLPSKAAVPMVVPHPHLPAGRSMQQAALAAVQAVGSWPLPSQAHLLGPAQQQEQQPLHRQLAAQARAPQQGRVQMPVADWQAPACFPAGNVVLQRSSSVPLMRSRSPQAHMCSGTSSGAEAAPALTRLDDTLQQLACPAQPPAFGGFWGESTAAPAAPPPAWECFTFRPQPSAAAMPGPGLLRASTAPSSLPALHAEAAPLATPFAEAKWDPWASEPASVAGGPEAAGTPAQAAQQPAAYSTDRAASACLAHAGMAEGAATELGSCSQMLSPFAAQADVPLPGAEPPRPADLPMLRCANLSMTGLAEAGELPSAIGPPASPSADLRSLFAAWQNSEAISFALPE